MTRTKLLFVRSDVDHHPGGLSHPHLCLLHDRLPPTPPCGYRASPQLLSSYDDVLAIQR
jgi:hypothetical protein